MKNKNFGILFFGLLFSVQSLAAERPNILFCFSDDWGQYASIYQDPDRPGLNDVIHTPTLDAIGRNGVVFRNAFVNNTVFSKRGGRAGVHTGATGNALRIQKQLAFPCSDPRLKATTFNG